MKPQKITSLKHYLEQLAPERKAAINKLRQIIKKTCLMGLKSN